MKSKQSYLLKFGALGFVVAAFGSALTFYFFNIAFFYFLNSSEVIPSWFLIAHIILFFTSFFGLSVICISYSKRKIFALDEIKIESEKILFFKEAVKPLLRTAFIIAFILIGLYGFQGYLFHRDREVIQQEYQNWASEAQKIDRLSFSQLEEGISVDVTVKGKSTDVYKIKLNLEATGYVKDVITMIERDVKFNFAVQEFSFEINFEEFAQKYYQILVGYVPSMKESIEIDENITVRAELKMSDPGEKWKGLARISGLPSSVKEAIIQLRFVCQNDRCTIVQSERPPEESLEN